MVQGQPHPHPQPQADRAAGSWWLCAFELAIHHPAGDAIALSKSVWDQTSSDTAGQNVCWRRHQGMAGWTGGYNAVAEGGRQQLH